MKKILYLVANKSEVMETLDPVDILSRFGLEVDLVSVETTKELSLTPIGLNIKLDKTISEIDYTKYDMLVIPGGEGHKVIDQHEKIDEIIEYFINNKKVSAICAAPTLLAKRGYLKGKDATSYKGHRDVMEENGAKYIDKPVVKTGNIITSQNNITSTLFAFEIAKALGKEKEANEKYNLIY